MPSLLAEDSVLRAPVNAALSALKDVKDVAGSKQERHSRDNQDERADAVPNGKVVTTTHALPNGRPSPGSSHEMPNGVASSTEADGDSEEWHEKYPRRSSRTSVQDADETEEKRVPMVNGRPVSSDDGGFASAESGHESYCRLGGTTVVALTADDLSGAPPAAAPQQEAPHQQAADHAPRTNAESSEKAPTTFEGIFKTPESPRRAPSPYRASSPPAFQPPRSLTPTPTSASHPQPPKLQQRHTLEVPRVSTSRLSREITNATQADDAVYATGRFSPNTPTRHRNSISLMRRATRSIHSDLQFEEVAPDDDAARWAEHIRQKRASKRKRKDDEDDDRVVVGTKVDQNHVNWVTAYNMLTGIRFTVSRTNAKLDRELTDADFEAKHKFSFDITGNELTPSAKYDFKFKDYAPWVFRHLRAIFKLDPADYLMSLTSKYILSELGSPGKSGSFFYFSRDYKYIIKTIHHAEHKFLRRILREYYNHIQDNPDTLLSQFYGLHRVKIPYGRKIHFVVMNNLFPPHRDIHRTFDLKGSTIGRDFREDDLEKNPRATLKDLNWLRRNLHLEFGPTKKRTFIEQMERDVHLLERLKIMDYSLLVGIHDLERGNEDKLRDKTLQVFQPGGDDAEDPADPRQAAAAGGVLMRTPSKLENARKAKELRYMIKTQRPIPMEQAKSGMPEELEEENAKKGFYFYSDDGGFRATHEDERPGEEIYYLGIIDCLTHYGFIKRTEHFWKGLSNPESQISAVPPDRYGPRFVRFINGITKTREAAELEKDEERVGMASPDFVEDPRLPGINAHYNHHHHHPHHHSLPSSESQTRPKNQDATDKVMEKAERQAEKSRRNGADESSVPSKKLTSARSPSPPGDPTGLGHTLPVVEEDVEGQSVGGRSGGRSRQPSPSERSAGEANADVSKLTGLGLPADLREGVSRADTKSPPTPPKDQRLSLPAAIADSRRSSQQRPHTPQSQTPSIRHVDAIDDDDDGRGALPPTPPKDGSTISRHRSLADRNKALPQPPVVHDEDGMMEQVLRPLDAT